MTGDATQTLYKSVVSLSKSLKIPTCLKEYGVSEEDYLEARPGMLKKAMADICTSTNPVAVDQTAMKKVMDQTYYGS